MQRGKKESKEEKHIPLQALIPPSLLDLALFLFFLNTSIDLDNRGVPIPPIGIRFTIITLTLRRVYSFFCQISFARCSQTIQACQFRERLNNFLLLCIRQGAIFVVVVITKNRGLQRQSTCKFITEGDKVRLDLKERYRKHTH